MLTKTMLELIKQGVESAFEREGIIQLLDTIDIELQEGFMTIHMANGERFAICVTKNTL